MRGAGNASSNTCDAPPCADADEDTGGSDTGQDDAPRPPGLPTLVGLDITPGDVELVSSNGSRPSQQFEVMGRWSDGSSGSLSGITFSIDALGLGSLDPDTGAFETGGWGAWPPCAWTPPTAAAATAPAPRPR